MRLCAHRALRHRCHERALQRAQRHAGRRHGAHRAQRDDRLQPAERAAALHPVLGDLERFAAQQLHPQPDAPVMLRDAVDGDDVRMANAREQPALGRDARRQRIDVRIVAAQQLQRDVTFELAVPRAVDVPETSAPQQLDQLELSPVADGRRAGRIAPPLAMRRLGPAGRKAAVQLRQLGDDAQLAQNGAVVGARLRLDGVPVDRLAVGDRFGERQQRGFRRHGSSPPRA